MGADIHMSISYPNGEYLAREIFEGRNSEWFDNLCTNGNRIYDTFPTTAGIPEVAPVDIESYFNHSHECGFYNFYYLTVGDFKKWFVAKRPDEDAGWVSTYERWLYESKGIYPDNLSHYLDPDMNKDDYHFISVLNPHDCSAWLFNYLVDDDHIPDDCYIIYYFDN